VASADRWRDEDGTGPITASFAVAMFLSFLLLATQTLVHLHALSTASSAAADAARRVATVEGSCDEGRAHVAALLGRWGDEVTVRCERGPEVVEVRIAGPSPARLAGGIAARVGIGEVDRAARLPVEVGP
jgi:hypothetical protein